jgi:hypothetical protein
MIITVLERSPWPHTRVGDRIPGVLPAVPEFPDETVRRRPAVMPGSLCRPATALR